MNHADLTRNLIKIIKIRKVIRATPKAMLSCVGLEDLWEISPKLLHGSMNIYFIEGFPEYAIKVGAESDYRRRPILFYIPHAPFTGPISIFVHHCACKYPGP